MRIPNDIKGHMTHFIYWVTFKAVMLRYLTPRTVTETPGGESRGWTPATNTSYTHLVAAREKPVNSHSNGILRNISV